MAARLLLGGALLLAACASQPSDPTVVTSDEDRQLNEAAAALEANGLPADDNVQDDSQ